MSRVDPPKRRAGPSFPPISLIVKHAELQRAIARRKWRDAYRIVSSIERSKLDGPDVHS